MKKKLLSHLLIFTMILSLFPSMGIGVAFAAQADTYIPLEVSGFNRDVVVEKEVTINSGSPVSGAAPFDGENDGARWALYETASGRSPGLPSNRRIETSSCEFVLTPYTQNNDLQLYGSSSSSTAKGSLTFAVQTGYDKIAFLGAGGNGDAAFTAKITYTDGTESSVLSATAPDWYEGTKNPGFYAGPFGRLKLKTNPNNSDEPAGKLDASGPYLFAFTIDTDQTKAIKSIDFAYTGGGTARLNIMAVSGVIPANTYTVTYDANSNGTGTMVNVSGVSGNFTLPANGYSPKLGFTFLGWATSPEGGTLLAPGSKINVTADTTLYAQWAVVAVTGVTVEPETLTLVAGETQTLTAVVEPGNANPAVEWTSGDTSVATVTDDGVVTAIGPGTATITATNAGGAISDTCEVTVKLTLIYHDNGASAGTAPVDSSSPYSSGTQVTVQDQGTLEKIGYTFTGWNTQANGEGTAYSADESLSITANTTLYAQWIPITYPITYDLKGGSVASTNPTAYTIESAATTLTNPTKTGYIFTGWEGTGLDSITTVVTIPAGSIGDRAYTAAWTAKQSTVTLDPNEGAAGTADEITATFDSPMPEILGDGSLPTRSGYTFKGYYDAAKDGVQYYDRTGKSVRNWDKDAAEVTLYAQWNRKSSSNTSTQTEKNPDGSSTTTTTNKNTGTVTETTKNADGTTGTIVTDKNGNVTELSAKVPAGAAKEAEKTGKPVALPVEVPASDRSEDAPAVKVDVPTGGAVVEIPVVNVTPGTVVVIVNENGTEQVVRVSSIGENGVVVKLDGNTTLKVVDKTRIFKDVHPMNHWATDAIDFVAARGIFNGTSADTFAPNDSMTRQAMWMILAHMSGEIPADMSGARQWAMENGVSDGTNPLNTVTRQQFVTMLWRWAAKEGMDLSVGEETNILSYTDVDKISDYAVEAFQWACGAGIVTGYNDGGLRALTNASRAHAAAMMMRFCESAVK